MKVKQLIKKLRTYPDDLAIIVFAIHEVGIYELESIEKVKVKVNQTNGLYQGDHEIIENANKEWDKEAILLS